MKKNLALLAIVAGINMMAGEAWAVLSPDMEGPSSGCYTPVLVSKWVPSLDIEDPSSGGSSSDSSSSGNQSGGSSSSGDSSSGSSSVSGSRSKYDLNDAVAALNPDGQDNTVTIGF